MGGLKLGLSEKSEKRGGTKRRWPKVVAGKLLHFTPRCDLSFFNLIYSPLHRTLMLVIQLTLSTRCEQRSASVITVRECETLTVKVQHL